MRKTTKIMAGLLVIAAGGWFAGCNSTIDDPNGPPVVLEVVTLTTTPITTNLDSSGTCTFTLTPATATFKNEPKNSSASTSPFNDINLLSVDIDYYWDDALQNTLTAGVGGTVPAASSGTGQFLPVSNAYLTDNAREGHSASLQLTFRGRTVAGDNVSAVTGGTLQVNSCVQANLGACCNGQSCTQQTLQNCVNSGGIYQGDFTDCLSANCQ